MSPKKTNASKKKSKFFFPRASIKKDACHFENPTKKLAMATKVDDPQLVHRLMRRVYTHYVNRVGKRVELSAEEKRLLEAVDWFPLLGVPLVKFNVHTNTQLHTPTLKPALEPGPKPEPKPVIDPENLGLAFNIVRTHANDRVDVPFELGVMPGALRLVGIARKHSGGATVLVGDRAYAVQNGIVKPVENLSRHLSSTDTQSKLVLYAPVYANITPFPVDEYQGVDTLHLVMQLQALRRWLWGDVACVGPDCAPPTPPPNTWPEPPSPALAEWLLANPAASRLWNRGCCSGRDVAKPWNGVPTSSHGELAAAVRAVQSQDTLELVVENFDQAVRNFPPHEASVLRRATEIELQRREIRDLTNEWRTKLAHFVPPALEPVKVEPVNPSIEPVKPPVEPLEPVKPSVEPSIEPVNSNAKLVKPVDSSLCDQYRTLLICEEQLQDAFLDLDWERDAGPRDFLHDVVSQLNDPKFIACWEAADMVDVADIAAEELPNSLRRALRMVNAQRQRQGQRALKLRSPIPHQVFKTWITLQRTCGPADDFGTPELLADYGLALQPSQQALRRHLWQTFAELEQMAVQCQDRPQAEYECQRLQLAVAALHKFRSAPDPVLAKQELLDTVRATASLKPLLADILAVVGGP